MADQKDDVTGISKLNVRPKKGVTKDFDQLLHKPKETSDLPLDDTHENLPTNK
jgi:hypothetical protein